jgi:predicted SAM-dependent methyltransferase
VTARLGLNLGCGDRPIAVYEGIDFLNLDVEHNCRKAAEAAGARFAVHDLTKHRLPADDATVSFINVAQVFEHLNLVDALRLLPDCWRVLKPLGLIRISVPDAAVLLRTHAKGKMDEFAATQPPVFSQVKSQTTKLGLVLFGSLHEHGETGHRQCYDEEGLREVLEMTWFEDVHRVPFDPTFDAPVAEEYQLAVVARKPVWRLS